MLTPGILLHSRYLIGKQLGQGGMGAVYEATDTKLDCLVAVKEAFTATDESGRRAFTREAKLLANLGHPALPRVTDYFDQDGALFLVMQYVAGEDLHAMMLRQRKPCRVADVMRWAEQLLDALDYLHTQTPPVIHRDIKPANIKLTSRNRVMLLDFGLAKGAAGLMSQASRSVFGGTPVFAPPEQVEGRGTDPRSDLFSFAATLWCLLTFKLPPAVTTRLLELHRHRPDPLEMANVINPEVSPAVAEVLHRAMSLDEEERPASAEAMREALLSGVATGVEAPPKPQMEAETVRDSPPAPKPEQAPPVPRPEIVPQPQAESAPPPPHVEASGPAVESVAAASVGSAKPEGRQKFLVAGGALALIVLLAATIGAWLWKGGRQTQPQPSVKESAQQDAGQTKAVVPSTQASAPPDVAPSATPSPAQGSVKPSENVRTTLPASATSSRQPQAGEKRVVRPPVSQERTKPPAAATAQKKQKKEVSLDDLINDTNH